jgi:hypothetical protein
LVSDPKFLDHICEYNSPPGGRLGRGHEQAVILPRVGSSHGGRGVAADTVRDQPFQIAEAGEIGLADIQSRNGQRAHVRFAVGREAINSSSTK